MSSIEELASYVFQTLNCQELAWGEQCQLFLQKKDDYDSSNYAQHHLERSDPGDNNTER